MRPAVNGKMFYKVATSMVNCVKMESMIGIWKMQYEWTRSNRSKDELVYAN